ncbi:uncharacterized protein LOC135196437 [Macrobrachium nipponense]|uniref:uncharacterized protein LOC135196437 n=1 Tax=Macrobrachium nipponense TaxID=159736 RepID=UPI0030C83942
MEKESQGLSPETSREEKFLHAKQKVKAWESEYFSMNGCRPDKDALTSAPQDIRKAYKVYCYYRKTLDGSRNSCSMPSDKNENSIPGTKCDVEISQNTPSSNGIEALAVNGQDESCVKDSGHAPHPIPCEESCANPSLNEKPKISVWGKHLNKVESNVEVPKIKEDSLYSKMAEKLRASGSVKVRTSLKKLTPGNRFKKSSLTASPASKECCESGPSALDLNSVDKENYIRNSPEQSSNNSNDAPFPDCSTVGDLLQEDVQSPASRLFVSLDNCERHSNVHSEVSGFESKLNSLSYEDSSVSANSTNSNAAGSYDLDSTPKIPFRVQKSQSIGKSVSQSLSTLSASIISEEPLERNIKKRSSLNRGWLARCIGSDADLKFDPSEYSETDDSWKMKLTDCEWNDDVRESDHNGIQEENSHLSHPKAIKKDRNKIVSGVNISGSKEKDYCTQESSERDLQIESKQDDEYFDEEKVVGNENNRQKSLKSAKSGKGRKRSVGRQKNNAIARTTNFNYSDDEDCENLSSESDYAGGSEESVTSENDELCSLDEFDGNMDGEQEATQIVPRRGRSQTRKTRNTIVEYDELNDNDGEISVKRRREEDLEELEQSGKIKSSWPPPKRVRKARKPSAKTANSRKKVENIKYAAIPVVQPEDCESKPIKVQRTKQRRKAPCSGVSNSTQVTRNKKNSDVSRDVKLDCSSKAGVPSSLPETKASRPRRAVQRKVTTELNNDGDEVKNMEANKETSHFENEESVDIKDYDELEDIESGGKKNKAKTYLNTEERFRQKVLSGSANKNYVRINLKKKVFVRGKKHLNLKKYKHKEWKKKKLMNSAEEGDEVSKKSLTCFKCGDFGHWAKNCIGKKGDNLMPIEEYDENESTFLSLEDAAALARGVKPTSVSVGKLHNSEQREVIENPVDESSIDSNVEVIKSATESLSFQENTKVPSPITTARDVCDGEKSKQNPSNKTADDEFPNDEFDGLFCSVKETCVDNSIPSSSQVYASAAPSGFNTSDRPSGFKTSDRPSGFNTSDRPTLDPLYELKNGDVLPTTTEVFEALKLFGYTSFRTGQENAIMRILSGMSTLLVLSTGSGKSLCYQLPAYLYAKRSNCVTLCISPLVSLMEDQVTGLPRFLRAVCLHANQNNSQRTSAINAIQAGNAQIILVSPEAIVGTQSGGILGTLLKDLPPVAFACLDEAHCVSEWSHNFRPSYLRVCQVLRERLGVRTILGLTATARHATAYSIAEHLEIKDFDNGIIRGASVPSNLLLSVSRDEVREQALIALLQGDRFSSCYSIIIYCTRRDECERVATLIRTQLMQPSKIDVKKNMKRVRALSYDAEAYHAGLSSYRRQQVQKQFMSGKLRIVVATVAFGMGIDKPDVRGIIHFNMPKNIESYVQEIGRAGRDGEVAHCHLFLDARDGRDIQELKRHIYANSLDRGIVRKLLDQVFKPCSCQNSKHLNNSEESPRKKECDTSPPQILPSTPCGQISSTPSELLSSTPSGHSPKDANTSEEIFPVFESSCCPKHEVALSIDDLVQKLDLPEENLETMLCYLELHWGNLVKLSSRVYANCTVACYGGPRQLVAVSRRCPPLAVAVALECEKGINMDKSNRISFPVVEVSSRMGWDSKIVKRELKALEWNTQNLPGGGKVKRSGVSVEFSDLSFHIESRGDLSDDERDQLLDAMFRRIQLREKEQLRNLHYIYQLLQSVSHKTILLCCDDVDMERCLKLREELSRYFAKEGKVLSDVRVEEQVYLRPDMERQICSSVRNVLSTHVDHRWTGRAMARVFHGISSPNFPAEVWGRVRNIWRLYLNVDFNLLVKVITQEILRCK